MNTHTDKTQENKIQSVANTVYQKSSGESTFQFVDIRPEAVVQRKLQEMVNNSPQVKQVAQLQVMADNYTLGQQQPTPKKENNTGLPDNLKSGIENLSGYSMDDVKVHYTSDKPAQLNAHAYAQGTDIHLASGQEKYLPHEAWHVVQQKQGRVKPTTSVADAPINDNKGLEAEADQMGANAVSTGQKIAQKKDKEHEIKLGVEGPAKSIEKTNPSFSSSMPSVQRIERPTIQMKRERDKEDDKVDITQLNQSERNPIQCHSNVIQLAIGSKEEALPGTRIMVVNPSAQDTGDLGTVIRPSTSKENCMAVEFDNEKGVYYRVYFNEINVVSKPEDPLEKPQVPESVMLKSMIDRAIIAAKDAEVELNKVMSADKTNTHGKIMLPKAQLEKCLIDCKGLSAEETAQYMYTTYFYGPLNRYLRNPEVRLESDVIQELIDVLHAFLSRAFNKTDAALVQKFRMELQAEWIDKTVSKDSAETGDALSFKAFTSTHPELAGVNGMWPDIENGSFGDVTKLALLVFQGTSKYLYPDAKYFPSEYEHILPPNTETKIVKKYSIKWIDKSKAVDDPKSVWTVTVYHLTIEGSSDVADFKLDFDAYGNIVSCIDNKFV